MDNAVLLVIFLAAAPIVLMPSGVALFLRSRHPQAIFGVNLLAWALICWALRGVMAAPPVMETPALVSVVLIVWLALMTVAIKTRAEAVAP